MLHLMLIRRCSTVYKIDHSDVMEKPRGPNSIANRWIIKDLPRIVPMPRISQEIKNWGDQMRLDTVRHNRYEREMSTVGRRRCPLSYRRSVSMTASRERFPRAITRYLPSGDQEWLQISIEVKFVNCLAGLPSMGWAHMFETPFFVRT